jgi:hypothetical protein
VRAIEVDAGGGGWDFALSLEKARLQVDDVVAQLVVLRLERFVELAQLFILFDLILELLDVLLLALAEGTLAGSVGWRVRGNKYVNIPERRDSVRRVWMSIARGDLYGPRCHRRRGQAGSSGTASPQSPDRWRAGNRPSERGGAVVAVQLAGQRWQP